MSSNICKELTGSKVFPAFHARPASSFMMDKPYLYLVAESEQNICHLPDQHISFVYDGWNSGTLKNLYCIEVLLC